jgi:hypothetical protein
LEARLFSLIPQEKDCDLVLHPILRSRKLGFLAVQTPTLLNVRAVCHATEHATCIHLQHRCLDKKLLTPTQEDRIQAKESKTAANPFSHISALEATMEYHKTKDILHVKEVLGHKSLNNTMLYTQLVNFKDNDFTAVVAHSEQEACKLIEGGFEFVCDFDGNKVFRKRK